MSGSASRPSISSPVARPLSRRQLLQSAAALGAAVVLDAACGSSTPTASPTAGTPVPLALASPPVSPTPGPLVLTEDLLARAQGPLVRLLAGDTLPLPGGKRATASDLESAGTAMDASGASPSFFPNPVAALGLLLAAADWSGQQGVLDLSVTLPTLPLQVVRLVLPGLPGGAASDTLAAAAPPGLVLRPGTALLLAGVLPDGRVVAGLADPVRRLSGHPRLELALLTPATLAPLLALVGASLDPSGTVALADGRTLVLATVDAGLATRLAAGAGVLFVDQVPLQVKGAKPTLTADPVVPTPDASVVSGATRASRAKDGRILALDAGGKAIGRAEYIGGTPPWDWLSTDGLAWTLREEADAIGWRVGVELTGWLFEQPRWQQIVRAQFNQGLLSWGVNWNEVEPNRGQYDFSVMDRLVTFAEANAMRVRVDSIVFGHTTMLPAWLLNGRFSARELRSILENHVSTIVVHYRGRVAEWVVCNEPYVAPYSTDDLFYASLGYDYIPLAFAAARRADPTAMLNFSDSYNHTAAGITTALTRQIVARLKAQKLIDVVGLQGHVDAADPPDPADVTATMRGYGMPVEVTSFDIDLSRVSGTLAQRYALQGRVAASMLAAARASGVCRDFSVWGIGDGYADRWLDRPGAPAPTATPFDANLKPKPFFTALLQGLA